MSRCAIRVVYVERKVTIMRRMYVTTQLYYINYMFRLLDLAIVRLDTYVEEVRSRCCIQAALVKHTFTKAANIQHRLRTSTHIPARH